VIDITYEWQSDTDEIRRIQIFPLHPNIPYITEDEVYMMSLIYDNNKDAKKNYRHSWKE